MTRDENIKVIKRYQNRKLYDTVDSCYITLEEIGDMVRAGDELKIIDNSSQEDITAITLAQIILEEQRKKRNPLPLDTFRELIISGGEAIKHLMSRGVQEIGHVKEFVDDKVKPAVQSFQRLPNFENQIKDLQSRLSSMEKELYNLKQKSPRKKK
ncbi:MAG: polyhydroxyalkanoate synthesis regulator DNA-binding domain-containing protein [Pseudomonadota bacterium]